MGDRSLRAGDSVRIRSAPEILQTLDEAGALEGVPFMPEMLEFIGGTHRVRSRALKVCSAIGNANMSGVVFLDELRCSGASHGACQAQCRIFWREEWLERSAESNASPDDDCDIDRLADVAKATVQQFASEERDGSDIFRCQATEIPRAGVAVDWREPRQYVREVTSGNITVWHMLRVMGRAFLRKVGKKLGLMDELSVKLGGASRVDGERLELAAGDWVEVRALEEIGRTLDSDRKHRGLNFTDEMAQHCGKRFRVKRRVERLIDEQSGRMLLLKNDCIELEGLVCSGDRATHLWFCRRDLYPYWREAWLRRVGGPTHGL